MTRRTYERQLIDLKNRNYFNGDIYRIDPSTRDVVRVSLLHVRDRGSEITEGEKIAERRT